MINLLNFRGLDVKDPGSGGSEVEHGILKKQIMRKSEIGLDIPNLCIDFRMSNFHALL